MAIYLLAQWIPKPTLKRALFYMSIWTILLFKMFETFLLQEEFFIREIEIQPLFFVVWIVMVLLILASKWLTKHHLEMIDLILFLPFFTVPNGYLLIIIAMFIFSIYWLIIGFQKHIHEKQIIGIMSLD